MEHKTHSGWPLKAFNLFGCLLTFFPPTHVLDNKTAALPTRNHSLYPALPPVNIGHKLQAAKPDQIEVGGCHRPTHWLRDTPPPAQPPDNHLKCPSKQYNKSLQVHLPRERVVMMQAGGERLF